MPELRTAATQKAECPLFPRPGIGRLETAQGVTDVLLAETVRDS